MHATGAASANSHLRAISPVAYAGAARISNCINAMLYCSGHGSGCPEPLHTLLLRLSPEESVQATLFESRDSGVYYERGVQEIIVLDEAKKTLFCIKRNGDPNLS